ncbi:MAG: hypothetical protein D3924_00990 [Candidatus Electrothrix sp. AR4]|nr:hypothetical protein [Candidatus Electrothrix sp. AR4]
MKLCFCFWKIKNESAVEIAWLRLMRLFDQDNNSLSRSFCNSSSNLLDSFKKIRDNDYIVCANIWQVFLTKVLILSLLSNAQIIYWVQGLVAEESFHKNKKKWRYFIFLLLERLAFKISDKYIFVSEYMETFYKKRYRNLLNKDYISIPCISDLRHNNVISRIKNSYCYIGGMSSWQQFDLVIKLMNEVIEINNHAHFFIATKGTQQCNKLLEKYASPILLANTKIFYLENKIDIENFLSSCEFGFLIREDIVLNHVASPIKLAEYLSCGVGIIGTDSLRSYTAQISNSGYLIKGKLFANKNIQEIASLIYDGEEKIISLYNDTFSIKSVSNYINNWPS